MEKRTTFPRLRLTTYSRLHQGMSGMNSSAWRVCVYTACVHYVFVHMHVAMCYIHAQLPHSWKFVGELNLADWSANCQIKIRQSMIANSSAGDKFGAWLSWAQPSTTLKSTDIFHIVWGQTAKFNSCQIFQLYGTFRIILVRHNKSYGHM